MSSDPKYRENNDRRWKVLLDKLVSEEGYVWWDVWNSLILYNLEKVHPFRRRIVSNVLAVIATISIHATATSIHFDALKSLSSRVFPMGL